MPQPQIPSGAVDLGDQARRDRELTEAKAAQQKAVDRMLREVEAAKWYVGMRRAFKGVRGGKTRRELVIEAKRRFDV